MEICTSIHQVTNHETQETQGQHSMTIRGDYAGLSLDLKMTHPPTVSTSSIVNILLHAFSTITGETNQAELQLDASDRAEEIANMARNLQEVESGLHQACQIAATATEPVTLRYIRKKMGGISEDRAHALIVAMLALDLIAEISTDGDYQPGKYKATVDLQYINNIFDAKSETDDTIAGLPDGVNEDGSSNPPTLGLDDRKDGDNGR